MIEQALAASNSKIISVRDVYAYIALVDEYGLLHKAKLYQQSFKANDTEKFMLAETDPIQLTVINT
jgi:hypothetical protein